jgi:hypothetical protein
MNNPLRSQIILFILISVTLTCCFGLFDSGKKRIIGKYIVIWIDLPQNQSLSEEFETNSSGSADIVFPYVFAVGHNDHYIIAKQHPTNGFEGGYKMDTTVTNYYILDIKTPIFNRDYTAFGPLTLNEFNSLRSKFEIESIPFDVDFPDNIYPAILLPDSLKRTKTQ